MPGISLPSLQRKKIRFCSINISCLRHFAGLRRIRNTEHRGQLHATTFRVHETFKINMSSIRIDIAEGFAFSSYSSLLALTLENLPSKVYALPVA